MLPIWEGWGKLHAPTGDFSVFISMYPATGGGRGTPGLSGTAALCTPRGERFRLKLTGGMHSKHVGLNTDGEPMTLHLYSRPYWYLVSAAPEQPPRIELYGKWSNPDLILDDRGSFASAFMADGTLYRGKDHSHSARGEPLQIRLAPGTRSDFDASCPSVASEQ